jgi:prophage antirepressor-like protein
LKYKNTKRDIKRAIRNNVDSNNRKEKREITKEEEYKSIHAQTIYINEGGLYELLINSRLPEAKKFYKWLLEEVIPKIREYGEYKLDEETKKKMEKINEKIKEMKKKVKILENNQKEEKYPEGGIIYVIRPIKEEKNINKIGYTKEMKKRMNTYNTGVADKMKVVYYIKVDKPQAIEYCVKGILYEYRYRGKKEYYKCGLKKIIEAIEKCNKIIKGKYYCGECKKEIDKKELKRHIIEENEEIEEEEKYEIRFEGKEQKGGNKKEKEEYYECKEKIKKYKEMMKKIKEKYKKEIKKIREK